MWDFVAIIIKKLCILLFSFFNFFEKTKWHGYSQHKHLVFEILFSKYIYVLSLSLTFFGVGQMCSLTCHYSAFGTAFGSYVGGCFDITLELSNVPCQCIFYVLIHI